jgi:hypothetical protein
MAKLPLPFTGIASGNGRRRWHSEWIRDLGDMKMGADFSRPFYETLGLRNFAILAGLFTVSISFWFLTAGTVKISQFPPDAFFYLNSLPVEYWAGLLATLALLGVRGMVRDRARTVLELSTLFLLCLYLFGLTSFVYQNPWFLDTYQHEGNALALLTSGGWYNGPVWYVYQFPGTYTFFAQLTAIAGIDPFQLMKYYPAGLSIVVAFLLYATVKSYSERFAAVSSAFILSGLWFQLHLSPQSLELIPYIGVLFLLIKIIDDKTRRRLWLSIATLVTPVLVLNHPETPLVMILGLAGLFVLQALFSTERRSAIRSSFRSIGPFFIVLACITFVWWEIMASGALAVVTSIVNGAIASGIGGLIRHPQSIPSTPAPSYDTTILLQEGISAIVWLIGLSALVFIRRFRHREYLLAGFFVAAVATIPVALFGNADVLQRSYLFALFPGGLLLASLLERGEVLRLKGRSLAPLLGKGLIMIIVCFSIAMPLSRYGLDSFSYLTQSSLNASDVAASLTTSHSILLVHPGWYGWRYYAPLNGYYGALLSEQNNITGRPGGFVKTNSESEFNLTYSGPDKTADYVLIPDFFQNLYILRFGSNSTSYINQKTVYESSVSMDFNLVYTTGTDHLYENRNLG